jgi:hypothetical protein
VGRGGPGGRVTRWREKDGEKGGGVGLAVRPHSQDGFGRCYGRRQRVLMAEAGWRTWEGGAVQATRGDGARRDR